MNTKKILDQIAALKAEEAKHMEAAELCRQEARKLREQTVNVWPNFLDSCNSMEPVFYKRFPSSEDIHLYYTQGKGIKCKENLPLYAYGFFKIKELAAIIKVLYSIKNQRENKIITFANLKTEYTGPEDIDRKTVAYMNFLIGEQSKLAEYEEYHGCFIDKPDIIEKNFGTPYRYTPPKLTSITRVSGGKKHDIGIGIYGEECINGISYYDSLSEWRTSAKFSETYNIFNPNCISISSSLKCNPNKNIGALLSFPLNYQDNFIAKALLSIAIYKKNIGKIDLTNEDYRYIFYELFRENIDISQFVEKNIPKKLHRIK